MFLFLAACVAAFPAWAEAPMRIVSLSGSLTEIVAELGLADRLVGVDRSSLRPVEATRRLPKVGGPRSVSVESVLAVSPTVVVAYEDVQPAETLPRLGSLGVKVVAARRLSTVDGAKEKIRTLAEGLGRAERGREILDAIDRNLVWPAGKPEPARRLRAVFIYTMGNGPLMVSGSGTGAEALMAAAKVDNAVTGFTDYRPLNAEALAAADPDIVILLDRALERIGGRDGLAAMPGMRESGALRDGRIVVDDESAYIGMGPSIGAAVRTLREAAYGR
jgi:iron complex transport system substrate-binding protein